MSNYLKKLVLAIIKKSVEFVDYDQSKGNLTVIVVHSIDNVIVFVYWAEFKCILLSLLFFVCFCRLVLIKQEEFFLGEIFDTEFNFEEQNATHVRFSHEVRKLSKGVKKK